MVFVFACIALLVSCSMKVHIIWVVPLPRIPVANEGLVRDSLLKMVHNPGGDEESASWEGGYLNI